MRPESTRQYTIGDIVNPETYTWSVVEGPAEITSGATGSTVDVLFKTIGEVKLLVTNGRDSRTLTIAVTPPRSAGKDVFTMTSTLNNPGVLRSGESDTLFLNFNQSLANNPTVSIINSDTTFQSGTLGAVQKLSGMRYYTIYTAGEGNGTPTVLVSGIEANAAFGGAKLANQQAKLYRIDNVAPVADVAYSQQSARNGSEVTGTVTFNEPVKFADPTKEAMLIMFSGPGVTAKTDTLVATDDPLVYTFDYTVTSESNGRLMVALDNISDMAGNSLAAVNNANGLMIDNLAPAVAGTATDRGQNATVTITSTESGTGRYLILKSGATAPTTVQEFMDMTGVASGSMDLVAGTPSTAAVAIENGTYNVYFLARDAAGNYSTIQSSTLVMN